MGIISSTRRKKSLSQKASKSKLPNQGNFSKSTKSMKASGEVSFENRIHALSLL